MKSQPPLPPKPSFKLGARTSQTSVSDKSYGVTAGSPTTTTTKWLRSSQTEIGALPSRSSQDEKSVSPRPGRRVTSSASPSVANTVEQELLALIQSDKSATHTQGHQFALFIQKKDWASIFAVLQSNSTVSSVPWIATLLKDVLGPLGDAQGFAKAIIGIAASIFDTIMTVKANNNKCKLLARRLQDINPALTYLMSNLSNKASALMSTTRTQEQGLGSARFKVETESLLGPLQTMRVTCEACAEAVEEWAAKGTRMFGALRKFLQAKNFALQFVDLSEQIAVSSQGLQLALQAVTFMNVELILNALPSEQQRKQWKAEMIASDARDMDELPGKVQVMMQDDPQFKQELMGHFDELKDVLQSKFQDLHSVLATQHEKTISHVTSEHELTRAHIGDAVNSLRASSSASLTALRFDWNLIKFDHDVDGPDCLGEGSFGNVYRCFWDGNEFAVKVLHMKAIGKKKLDDLTREALKMATIQHPNTVRLRGVCFEAPNYGLVMDKCDPDLHVFLGSNEIVPSQQWTIALQIAKGMEEVHANGIIHGDLRTPNIMMGNKRTNIRARVSDFGLAMARSESATKTKSAILSTTNVTRAPEVIDAMDPTLTMESDVWSYGVILFQILTGKVIWSGKSVEEVVSFYRQKTMFPMPRNVQNPALVKLIRECWNFDPNQRPSFREIRRGIEANDHADAELNQDYETVGLADRVVSDAAPLRSSAKANAPPPAMTPKMSSQQTYAPASSPVAAAVPVNRPYQFGDRTRRRLGVSTAAAPASAGVDASIFCGGAEPMRYEPFRAQIRSCRKNQFVAIDFGLELSYSSKPTIWEFVPLPTKDGYHISTPCIAAQTLGAVPEQECDAFWFLDVLSDAKNPVMKVKLDPKDREAFVFRPYNQPGAYGIASCSTKKIVCAEDKRLICNKTNLGDWEKFTVECVDDDRIASGKHPICFVCLSSYGFL
jgi:serine/threonine protein kinase